MNILKFWKHLFIDQFTFYMGGGGSSGGGQPTQSTSYQTNVPEYAKPYVTNMLESTQQQLFNTQPGPEGTTQITGFKPYQPYSSNVNDYFAGFSPMQQQAQQDAANLQTPSTFGQGAGMAGIAGLGALGTTGQAGMYGMQGNMAGQRAAGMSNMYGGMGAQSGQQAAGMSNMYGGLGAQSGQQYAGQSAGAGQQGSDIGQQYAGQSGIYGGLGAMQGMQGANIGSSLAQQSQNPNAVQSYMNPYLQASLNPQLAEIQRQYDITGQQQAGQATQAGAFGGGRDAVMAAENARNKNTAMNQAIGQGYNTAFNTAQQQMNAANQAALAGNQQALSGYGMGLQGAGQAGTQALAGNQQALSGYGQAGSQALAGYGMGLQGAGQAGSQSLAGYGMGLQGAGQAGSQGIAGAQAGLQGVGAQQAGYGQLGAAGTNLSNIGNQQLQAQQGIIGLQNQMGAQQQAQEQNKINQSIQDYATQQQYPLMQLGFMSNMLRGLPMQATNTQSYQAQPSAINQGLGVLAGVAGAKQAGVFKEGGTIKGLAGGGAIRYANTGAVEANPESGVARGIQAKLSMMSEDQLKQIAQTSPSEQIRQMANELIAQKEIAKQAEAKAEQSMPTPVSERVGLPAAPAPSLDGMSSGGIASFAGDSKEGSAVVDPFKLESDEDTINRLKQQYKLAGIEDKPMDEYGKFLARQAEGLPQQRDINKGRFLMDFGTRLASSTGPLLVAGSRAAAEAAPESYKREEALMAREGQLAKGQAEIQNADRLEKMGFIKEANAERAKGMDRIKEYQLQESKNKSAYEIQELSNTGALSRQELANKGSLASALAGNRKTDYMNMVDANVAKLIASGRDPKDPSVLVDAHKLATADYRGGEQKIAVQAQAKMDAAHKEVDKKYSSELLLAETPKDRAAIENKIQAEKKIITDRYMSALKTLEPGEQNTPTETKNTGALPLPSRKEDLETGKIYDTSKGPAKWDGKTFVKG